MMTHRQYKEWIQLSVLDELTTDERELLGRHLDECGECRAELEQLTKFTSRVHQRQLFQPTDQLLQEARQELRVALRLERMKQPIRVTLKTWWEALSSGSLRLAAGGVAMVAIGMLLGYLIFSGGDTSEGSFVGSLEIQETTFSRGETRVTNVRFLASETVEGEVEFIFEAVTPIRMKGSVQDPAVQRILAQALVTEQNPGARLRTVSTLGAYAEQSNKPDQEIKAALIQALKSDGNVGVRKEALRVLQRFPMDKEIQDALLHVLRHELNPGLRIEAINILEKPVVAGQWRNEEIKNVLREKMESDQNNYIRLRARNVYEEVYQQ
jgi:hypothetical protein